MDFHYTPLLQRLFTASRELAAAHGIVLHELTTIKASLEDAYLELTGGNTEYNTSIPRGQADQPVAQQHALR